MRQFVEDLYNQHIGELTGCAEFVALEEGSVGRDVFEGFVGNVFLTHQNSPHFLGFLFALVPPNSVERIEHNLLEEMGLDEEDGRSHPELLMALLEGMGLQDKVSTLKAKARTRLDEIVLDPLLYGSLREVGLSALVEVVSFEYMLSRVSSRIGRFLKKQCDLTDEQLEWFFHHSEVDIQHAEEGLDTIEDYIAYYEFDPQEAQDIIGTAMRENVFIKRYFGIEAAARARGME
jgi:pyrroloquinoline quinone (PQQ) biosynthesis protein C